MKYCPRCGAKIADSARNCHSCHMVLATAGTAATTRSAAHPRPDGAVAAIASASCKPMLLLVGAIAVLLTVLLIVAVLPGEESCNKTSQTETWSPGDGIEHSGAGQDTAHAPDRPPQCYAPYASAPGLNSDAPYMPGGQCQIQIPLTFEAMEMMEQYSRAAAEVERRNWEEGDKFRKMQERVWNMTPEQLRQYRQEQAGERAQLEIEAKDRALMQEMGEHERAWAVGQTRDEMLKAQELDASRIGDEYSDTYQTPGGDLYRIKPDGTSIKIYSVP